ncbi:hypothetical protein AFERRI_30157 [Acidithiobacillus ferrivorans]|uniref:Uncharacterized protein n=1 Tax=Acidithiobacillus ferrivorans TaxID=160808 RepID=A0A060UMJ7_9PROT|nr:hypothetical protein AFERRI_30157 [Acidithiobacillus ferrivorans]
MSRPETGGSYPLTFYCLRIATNFRETYPNDEHTISPKPEKAANHLASVYMHRLHGVPQRLCREQGPGNTRSTSRGYSRPV